MTMQEFRQAEKMMQDKEILEDVKALVNDGDPYFGLEPRIQRYLSEDCVKVIKQIMVSDIMCQIEKCNQKLKELGIE